MGGMPVAGPKNAGTNTVLISAWRRAVNRDSISEAMGTPGG
jgi:hypothetical protein